MEERSSFHPLDYLSVLRRRKWWFVGPLVACLAIGAAAGDGAAPHLQVGG